MAQYKVTAQVELEVETEEDWTEDEIREAVDSAIDIAYLEQDEKQDADVVTQEVTNIIVVKG
jgi:hypothetical protein